MFQENEVKVNEESLEKPTEKSHLSFNIQANVPTYDSMGFKEYPVAPLYQIDLGKNQNFFPYIKAESKEPELLDSFMRQMDKIKDSETLAKGIISAALTTGARFELPKREKQVIFFELSSKEREVKPLFPGVGVSSSVKDLLFLHITERLKATFILKRNLWAEQKATILIFLAKSIQELKIEWKSDQTKPFIEKIQKSNKQIIFVYEEDEKKKEIVEKNFISNLRKKLDESIDKFCKNYLQQENIVFYLPVGMKNSTTEPEMSESVIVALLNGMQLPTLKEAKEISITGLYAEKNLEKNLHKDLNQFLIDQLLGSMLLKRNLDPDQRYQLIFLVAQAIQKQIGKEELVRENNTVKFVYFGNKEQFSKAIEKALTFFEEKYLTVNNQVSIAPNMGEEEQTIRCYPSGCSLM